MSLIDAEEFSIREGVCPYDYPFPGGGVSL